MNENGFGLMLQTLVAHYSLVEVWKRWTIA